MEASGLSLEPEPQFRGCGKSISGEGEAGVYGAEQHTEDNKTRAVGRLGREML